MPVRFAFLPAQAVFNLTSPRYLPEVSSDWRGSAPWHSDRYEPLRDLIEQLYIGGFNAISGHYQRLEDSIRREGIRNPIMVSAGGLERRRLDELPPSLGSVTDLFVSEYLGGSRLWVAQRLDIDVPCVINDYTGRLTVGDRLKTLEAVLATFVDRPRQATLRRDGTVAINDLPYVHLPEGERYSVEEQSRLRQGIIRRIRGEVDRWLEAHDRSGVAA
jgi:hypothetical protein